MENFLCKNGENEESLEEEMIDINHRFKNSIEECQNIVKLITANFNTDVDEWLKIVEVYCAIQRLIRNY